MCPHAGGNGKPVEGLQKGATFRGYWIYIWAPSPVKAQGPEASSPSLSHSAHGYGVPRPTDQEMVETEAGQAQMPGEGSPGSPSHPWPSEVQIPRVCLPQTPLTPLPAWSPLRTAPPPPRESPTCAVSQGRGENRSAGAGLGEQPAPRPPAPDSHPPRRAPSPKAPLGPIPRRRFLLVPSRPSPTSPAAAAPSPWLRGLRRLAELGVGIAPGGAGGWAPRLPTELGSFKIRSRLRTADSRPAYLRASLKDTLDGNNRFAPSKGATRRPLKH